MDSMNKRFIGQLVAGAVLFGLSQTAAAGVNVIINLGADGSAQAVPALGNGLLIALGILLAVIAYRFSVSNRGVQRMLSVAVLAGGTLLAVWGAERTVAGYLVVPVPPEDPVCSSGGTYALDTGSSLGIPVDIENQCESATLTVLSYENLDCPGGIEIVDADVGDTIAPGATATSNFCRPI